MMVGDVNIEDDDIVIHPRQSRREIPIPETGLLLVNPVEARYGIEAACTLGAERRSFYHSNLCVDTSRGYFVAGPAIGAPLAVMTLEKLIALGAKKVYLFGWCGSMAESLSIGDLLIPTSARRGEGTSAYYVPDSQPSPSLALTETLGHQLDSKSLAWSEGCVWSTDAPYREKKSYLKELHEEYGVSAVDMEHSALCSVAFFRNIQFAALLLVSDEVWGKNWKPGYSKQEFKTRSRMLIDIFIQELPL
jgi:uridine phosphorylase